MKHDKETGEVRLDDSGHEVPDKTPLELPVGFKQQETVAQMVARLVRRDVSLYAAQHGAETFDEADDFEIDDDPEPFSPFETDFDPTLGRELTPADFMDPEKRETIKGLYLEADRNRVRSEALQDHINELYRLSKDPRTRGQKPGAGQSPANSSEGTPKASEPPTGPK